MQRRSGRTYVDVRRTTPYYVRRHEMDVLGLILTLPRLADSLAQAAELVGLRGRHSLPVHTIPP